MEGTPLYLTGIDWASDKHDVCVLDPGGAVEDRFVIARTAEGLAELIRRLRRLGDPAELPIAIERPSGLLVNTPVEAYAYCGRRSPADLIERLRSAPAGHAHELESETKGHLVRSLVSVLRPIVAQIRELDGLIAALLHQHRDGHIVQSFPRTGTVNAAQILAELGDDRLRFASDEQLAAEAGVAPVTNSCAKHRAVFCRFACNKPLGRALTIWAAA
jgi:transposase